MTKDNKVVALSTTVAMTMSVLAVLIGSGIGWGILQTKVSSLEARAETVRTKVAVCNEKKLDKTVYYKDNSRLHDDIKDIRADLKQLLMFSRKTR